MTEVQPISRRVLVLAFAVVVVSAAVGAGTYGLFSDSASSAGNAVQAGTVDLSVGSAGTKTLNVSNVAPGANGLTRLSLSNTGSLAGNVTLAFSNETELEGANPSSETNTAPPGDLGSALRLSIAVVHNGTRTPVYEGSFAGAFDRPSMWTGTTLPAGGHETLLLNWSLPRSTGNDVQGDIAGGAYTVRLTQTGTPVNATRPAANTNGTRVTRTGSGVVLSPSSPSRTLDAAVPPSDRASATGVSVTHLSVTYDAPQSASVGVSQTLDAPRGVPSIPNGSLAYFDFRHPGVADSAIRNATFTVRVRKPVVVDPANATFAHYANGSWDPVPTTLVNTTADAYVYRVRATGMSPFSLVSAAVGALINVPEPAKQILDRFDSNTPQHRGAIHHVTPVHVTDFNGNGVPSSFDLRVRANTTLPNMDPAGRPGDPEFIVEANTSGSTGWKTVSTTHVDRKANGTFVLPLDWQRGVLNVTRPTRVQFRVVLADDDRWTRGEVGVDIGARVDYPNETVEPMRAELGGNVNQTVITNATDVYRTMDTRGLNANWWSSSADRAAGRVAATIRAKLRNELDIVGGVKGTARDAIVGKLVSYAGTAVQDSLETVTSVIRYASLAVELVENARAAGTGITREAVSLHLDDAGTSHVPYQHLHADLGRLRTNDRRLQRAVQAGNATRKRRLLRTRRRLLVSTYGDLPAFLDGVHESVVRNTVGGEDPGAYVTVRSRVALLRQSLIADYGATTRSLGGSNKSLRSTAQMPTHGFVTGGHALVYDTMDTKSDWTLYRIGVPASMRGSSFRVRLRSGAGRSGAPPFDARLLASRPSHPASASGGRAFEAGDGFPAASVSDANASYYVLVRSGGSLGPYTLQTDGNLHVSVVARHGPDVQRPSVSLVDAPSATTLQSGHRVRTVSLGNASRANVSLAWRVWDAKTRPSNLQYRLRVDNGSGFTSWGAWRNATGGRVSYDASLPAGVHRVQLMVRDASGKRTLRNVDVVVSGTTPQTYLASDGDPHGDAVYAKVLPADRRVRNVTLQYRSHANGSWVDWKTVSNTSGFGELHFHREGTYALRARAVGIAGNVGPWHATNVTYRPPDTERPDITVERRPASRTNAASTTVAWSVHGRDTPLANLTYQVSFDGGPWSANRSVPAGHGVTHTWSSPSPGHHEARIRVFDGAGNPNESTVGFAVDRTPPTLRNLSVAGRTTGVHVSGNVSEPASLAVQYRAADGSWTPAGRVIPQGGRVGVSHTGSTRVRVRAVDRAGNAGSWHNRTVTVAARPSSGGGSGSSGTSIDKSVDNGQDVTIPTDGASGGSSDLIRAAINSITGRTVIDFYLQYRDGTRHHLTSIRPHATGNMSVRLDLPPSLKNGTLHVSVGNGSAYLDSVRAIGARPPAPGIDVSAGTPTVGTAVALNGSDAAIDVANYTWTLDGSRTLAGRNVTWTPRSAGNHTVSLTVTDRFGATNATARPVNVDAPPTAAFGAPATVRTGETVTLNASNASDPDGSIRTYRWSVSGSTSARSGPTLNTTFADDGTYTVTLAVTDDRGVTRTTNATIRVVNRPPDVSLARTTDRTPVVGHAVTLSAAASADPDGHVANYSWTVDGSPVAVHGPHLSPTFSSSGTHTVTVTATDDDGATNATTMHVSVDAPPTATLSSPSTVPTGRSVTFDASGSHDPDGSVASYAWTLDGTPLNANGPTLTHTFGDEGTYPVSVTVTDDRGVSRTANATVTVTNRPPTANATVTSGVPVANATTAFSAAASTDPDGSVAHVAWDFGANGSTDATGVHVTHRFASAGVHAVRVTVTDDDGATNTTTLQVHVDAPPAPAIAVPSGVYTDANATLSAAGSTDPDGSIRSVRWSLAGRTGTPTGANATVRYPDEGTYPVSVTVTDDRGVSRTANATLRVLNRPPTAVISAKNASANAPPVPNATMHFSAAASTDPDGSVVNESWAVDGTSANATGPTFEHAFATPGNHTVTLTVTDDDGATNATTRTVHVDAPPVARFDAPPSVVAGGTLGLDASNASDPDGTITAYRWSLDGTPVLDTQDPTSTAVVRSGTQGSTASNATVIDAAPGTHTLALTVVDDRGASTTVRQNLTVLNRSWSLDGPTTLTAGDSALYHVPRSPGIANVTWTVVGADANTTGTTSTSGSGGASGAPSLSLATGEQTDGWTAGENASGWYLVTPNASAGLDAVRATVTGIGGGTWTLSRNVSVSAPAPSLAVDAPAAAEVGHTVTVTANATSATNVTLNASVVGPNGTTSPLAWTTETGSRATATHVFDAPGTYTVRVTAATPGGASTTRTRTVTVTQAVETPHLYVNRYLGGRVVSLRATVWNTSYNSALTTGTDGRVARFAWDTTGDGSIDRNGSNVTVRYATPGVHTVHVTAIDTDGDRTTVTRNVTVAASANATLSWRASDSRPSAASGTTVYGVTDATAKQPSVNAASGTGNTSRTVRARWIANGTTRWTVTLNHPVKQVSLAGGALYVTGNGSVSRVDPATGAAVWTTDVGDFAKVVNATNSAVTLRAGGNVTLLDAADGTTRWSLNWSTYHVVRGGGTIYASNTTTVRALDVADGTTRWTYTSQSLYGSSSVAANGTFYAVRYDGVTALDAATGATRWTYNDTSFDPYSATVANGTVYAPTYASGYVNGTWRSTHGLLAVTDGNVTWRTQASAYTYVDAVTNGTVYWHANGVLHAAAAATGTEAWSTRVGGYVNSVSVRNGRATVNAGRDLVVVDAANGTVRTRVQAGYGPTVRGRTVIFTAGRDTFAATVDR